MYLTFEYTSPVSLSDYACIGKKELVKHSNFVYNMVLDISYNMLLLCMCFIAQLGIGNIIYYRIVYSLIYGNIKKKILLQINGICR